MYFIDQHVQWSTTLPPGVNRPWECWFPPNPQHPQNLANTSKITALLWPLLLLLLSSSSSSSSVVVVVVVVVVVLDLTRLVSAQWPKALGPLVISLGLKGILVLPFLTLALPFCKDFDAQIESIETEVARQLSPEKPTRLRFRHVPSCLCRPLRSMKDPAHCHSAWVEMFCKNKIRSKIAKCKMEGNSSLISIFCQDNSQSWNSKTYY